VQQRLQTLTTGATWIMSPTLSNELRVNWSRNVGKNFQALDTFGGAVVRRRRCSTRLRADDSVYRVNFGPSNVFFDEGGNASNMQRQLNIVDAVLLTRGRHQVRSASTTAVFCRSYDRTVNYVHGIYVQREVAGASTGRAGTPDGRLVFAQRSSHATNFSTYAQDCVGAGSRLTLTYGIRWDVNPPPALNDTG
jgi:hypothetical protein